jgi:MoaA/NifB/PqqE/SkfB family radical SAM enzyme
MLGLIRSFLKTEARNYTGFAKTISSSDNLAEQLKTIGSADNAAEQLEPISSADNAAEQLWSLHPDGAYFIERGGRDIPPPIHANIPLTNKCNLRCEICGSQKVLDRWGGAKRRHMTVETFDSIARTIFPFLRTVELNSQGDPLLHPEIDYVLETIRNYDCDVKVQTNGTLFTRSNIDLLTAICGEVNISLDAVGSKFDEVRKGGVWSKAEAGIKSLLAQRDPERLAISLYPTVTRRTAGEAINILDWAAKHNVDSVNFHCYQPLPKDWSFEEAPTETELHELRSALSAWISAGGLMEVRLDGDLLSVGRTVNRRSHVSSAVKAALTQAAGLTAPTYPLDKDKASSDPVYVCPTPNSYVEISLDGFISACCRSQEVFLGSATSVESFAKAWFGHNYQVIRDSLKRESNGEYPLPSCDGCVKVFAPNASKHRSSMSYEGVLSTRPDGLKVYTEGNIIVDRIDEFSPGVFRAGYLQPGIDPYRYVLVQEGSEAYRRVDSIDAIGPACFFLTGRVIYFSTRDGSSPIRNGKNYYLRPSARHLEHTS